MLRLSLFLSRPSSTPRAFMHSSNHAATRIRNPMVRPRLPLRPSAMVGSGGSRVPSGPAPPPSALSLMLLFLSQEPEGRPGPGPGFGLRPPAAGPAMSSVCGGSVGAGSLPSELVVHIFSFLAAPDRLRASAACSHWRECLFYPALWPRLRLSLRVCPAERPRLDFLMRKCGWFVRELRVQFAADNYPSGGAGGSASGVCQETAAVTAAVAEGEAPLCPRWLELLRTYLELVLCVLSSVRNNRIQQLFEEILGNSRQLKWLSCGFMLQIVTPTSLSSLSNSIASTMEHLSLLDNHIPGAVVDLISRQYDKFLTHFILMNDVIDMSGFPDLSDNRTEDPLVLLAWRCTRLSLLAVHGYTVWAHNLIAIARLRGSDLKVLEVTEESIDFDNGELADQDVDPVHNLIEQVSLGLGRPWHAVMDIELLSVFTEPTRHFYREMQSFSEGI
uniref:F-box protein 33 n=1 Tax=Naja naja TaxID=35670 RepID=A0A8C7DZP1_NAJNA